MTTRARTFRHVSAFTLVEAIVVIVLISILAGLTVPRMLSVGPRALQTEMRSVERLLSIAVEKATMLSDPVAVEYDDKSKTLSVAVQRARTDSTGQRQSPDWRADPLVEPVIFDRAELRDARTDGMALQKSRWRVVFTPGQPRPELVLILAAAHAPGAQPSVITLPNFATRAVRSDDPARPHAAALSGSIDLDDAGKGTKPW